MFIYSLTNKVNGKRYIGQTTRSVQWRWNQHRKHKNSVPFPIYKALLKYGEENFAVEVLAVACSIDCLNYLEPLFIAAYKSLVPNGYNLDSGGKNNLVHPDTVARMSTSKKGRKFTPEHRAKIAIGRLGIRHTLETRAKQSSIKSGRRVTVDEYKQIYTDKHTPKGPRTHCKRGHLFPTEPNTFESGKAYRRCRICMREYQTNYDKTVRLVPHGQVRIEQC